MSKRQIAYSVIIPTFNNQQGIDNIISKNTALFELESCEVIIVDDGSARPITLENSNDWLRIIHLSGNAGVAEARNRGISEAKGDWIIFLDSDDYLTDDYFQVLGEAIKNNPREVQAFSFGSININGKGKIKQIVIFPRMRLRPFMLLVKNFCVLSGSVVKRSVGSQVLFKTINHEDLEFWYQVSKRYPMMTINKIGTIRRVGHVNSLSSNKLKSIFWHYSLVNRHTYNVFIFLVICFLHAVVQFINQIVSRTRRRNYKL